MVCFRRSSTFWGSEAPGPITLGFKFIPYLLVDKLFNAWTRLVIKCMQGLGGGGGNLLGLSRERKEKVPALFTKDE